MKVFKTIEWTLFAAFCIFSIIFIREVLEKFYSRDTSFKHYNIPVFEHPTITICLSQYFENGTKYQLKFNYGLDFRIKYHYDGFFLNKGKNYRNDSKEMILFEEIVTSHYGYCYKITTKSDKIIKGDSKYIKVYFNESIPHEHLPSLLKLYFTSEENSYGIIANAWMDGKVMLVNLNKNSNIEISIRPESYIYLNEKFRCSNESFYKCYTSHLNMINFENCPRKCLTVTLPDTVTDQHLFCKTEEEWNCIYKIQEYLWYSITANETCPKSCSILQYTGNVVYEHKYQTDKHSYKFAYLFNLPEKVEVYEEYLIYDVIGMIGSIGGTLGMCIGFSFTNMVTIIINFIQYQLKKLSKKVDNEIKPFHKSISEKPEKQLQKDVQVLKQKVEKLGATLSKIMKSKC